MEEHSVQKSESEKVSPSSDAESAKKSRMGNDVGVYADGLQMLANTAEEQLTTCAYVYNKGSSEDNKEQQNGIFLVVQSADGEGPPKIVHVDSKDVQTEDGEADANDANDVSHVPKCNSEKESSGMDKNADDSNPFFRCFKCEQLFDTQKDCVGHIDKYHRITSQHVCPICTTVMSIDAFLEHADTFHFRCKLCPIAEPAVFDSQKKLEMHTLRTHKTECYICHKKIFKQSLSEHMTADHPLTCTLCFGLEMFENEQDLNKHLLRVHHSVCAFCRKYVLKKDLAAHIAKQHRRCDVCYKTFDTTDDLRRHAGERHGTRQVAAPVRYDEPRRIVGETETLRVAFYCTVCYVDFPTKALLDNHKASAH